MAKWWQQEKEPEKKVEVDPNKKEDDKFELKPEEVKSKLDQIDGLKTSVDELKSKSGVLDRMNIYLDEQDAKKKEELKTQRKEYQESVDEDLETQFLTDPMNATKRVLNDTMRPLVESQVNTNARLTMNDLFSNHGDEFEYAHDPIIRKEVEANVAKLPLAARTDPESIRNCYYVVTGRHQAEIKEGKIKSKTASASSSGTGTGAPGTKQEETVTLSDAEKKAAKVFGLSESEYAKQRKELSYV